MNKAAEIAQQLLQINAIKLQPQRPFTWASGIQSPIYCDNRLILSYPGIRDLIKMAFVKESARFDTFDMVAGVATAGIAHGALLADALRLPFVYVRSRPKSHGRENLIEGTLEPGAKVLVIEDLISTAGSCLKAVDALRDAGAEVVGILAIFTYGFKEAQLVLDNAGVPFYTLTHYDILLAEAVKAGYIATSDLNTLNAWRSNPKNWEP